MNYIFKLLRSKPILAISLLLLNSSLFSQNSIQLLPIEIQQIEECLGHEILRARVLDSLSFLVGYHPRNTSRLTLTKSTLLEPWNMNSGCDSCFMRPNPAITNEMFKVCLTKHFDERSKRHSYMKLGLDIVFHPDIVRDNILANFKIEMEVKVDNFIKEFLDPNTYFAKVKLIEDYSTYTKEIKNKISSEFEISGNQLMVEHLIKIEKDSFNTHPPHFQNYELIWKNCVSELEKSLINLIAKYQ